ncbi:TPA: PepSY-associated TM helix domain-containing protein [Providencia rettgeri]
MSRQRTPSLNSRLDKLHRSAGALFGVFLFVILFTGCWSLGSDALRLWWAHAPLSGEQLPLEKLIELQPDATMIQLPQTHSPVITFCQGRGECGLSYSAISGKAIVSGSPAMWLVTLHKNLFIDFPGRVFISLFGFAFAVLLITGSLIQRHRLRSMMRVPRLTHLTLFLRDVHSWLGLWSSPWLVLFAVTGALSGLGALGTVSLAQRAAPDDPQVIMKTLMGEFEPLDAPLEVSAKTVSAALATLQQVATNFIPQTAMLQDGQWVIGGVREGQLSTSNFEQYLFNSQTEQIIAIRDSAKKGGWTRAFIAIQPLHYGQYQWLSKIDNTLSTLHFLAGVSALLLVSSGLGMWCWRRMNSLASRLIVGSCGGLLFATSVLLASMPWALLQQPEEFFILWGIACIAGGMVKNAQHSLMLFTLLSALLLLSAFITVYGFGSLPFSRIDLVLLCSGLGLLFILFSCQKLSYTPKRVRSEYERSITK